MKKAKRECCDNTERVTPEAAPVPGAGAGREEAGIASRSWDSDLKKEVLPS